MLDYIVAFNYSLSEEGVNQLMKNMLKTNLPIEAKERLVMTWSRLKIIDHP